jgi:hypothetical protein
VRFRQEQRCPAGRTEPPSFEDNETTIDALKAWIRRTVELSRASEANGGQRNARDRAQDPRPGLQLQGLPYLAHIALPNFFFHATTAYDILRHNGVELGKRDFIGTV